MLVRTNKQDTFSAQGQTSLMATAKDQREGEKHTSEFNFCFKAVLREDFPQDDAAIFAGRTSHVHTCALPSPAFEEACDVRDS